MNSLDTISYTQQLILSSRRDLSNSCGKTIMIVSMWYCSAHDIGSVKTE